MFGPYEFILRGVREFKISVRFHIIVSTIINNKTNFIKISTIVK